MADKQDSKPTSYRILRSTDGVNWKLVGVSTAVGQKKAIRDFLDSGETSATATGLSEQYQAVPSRSWNPQVVQVETRVVSSLVDASTIATSDGTSTSSATTIKVSGPPIYSGSAA